ncbi:MAG: hypothetical protein ACRDAX_00570 [Propionibacteriaceae bacterium]
MTFDYRSFKKLLKPREAPKIGMRVALSYLVAIVGGLVGIPIGFVVLESLYSFGALDKTCPNNDNSCIFLISIVIIMVFVALAWLLEAWLSGLGRLWVTSMLASHFFIFLLLAYKPLTSLVISVFLPALAAVLSATDLRWRRSRLGVLALLIAIPLGWFCYLIFIASR